MNSAINFIYETYNEARIIIVPEQHITQLIRQITSTIHTNVQDFKTRTTYINRHISPINLKLNIKDKRKEIIFITSRWLPDYLRIYKRISTLPSNHLTSTEQLEKAHVAELVAKLMKAKWYELRIMYKTAFLIDHNTIPLKSQLEIIYQLEKLTIITETILLDVASFFKPAPSSIIKTIQLDITTFLTTGYFIDHFLPINSEEYIIQLLKRIKSIIYWK